MNCERKAPPRRACNVPTPEDAKLMIRLPRSLRERIIDLSLAQGVTPSELVEAVLARSFGADDDEIYT